MGVSDRNDIRSFPGRPFKLPDDQRLFLLQFWNLHQAAKEWGCSYQTARRWVLLHPDVGVLVRVQSPRALIPRWQLCVFAGQPKFDHGEGAEHFRSSTWQRSMARRRWRQQRAAGRAAAAPDRLPVPHYGRCRQPIPGTNFPNHVQDLRQQLPADHKPLPGQLDMAEYIAMLTRRPVPRS